MSRILSISFLVMLLSVVIIAQMQPEMTSEWILHQLRLEKLNKAVCFSKPVYGKCRGHRNLWYFNAFNSRCERFVYSNCAGNRNRFYTKTECDEFCTNKLQEWKKKRPAPGR